MRPFVLVDGLDGSGKGAALDALRLWAVEHKKKILDLPTLWREEDDIPRFEEAGEHDAIISAEPTYALVGKGIRDELIKDNGRAYSAHSIALAFSLDREILYRRLLIPALKAGKTIFQDRGITTSLVYQPAQGGISLNEVLNLPGNRLALQWAPGLVIIPRVSVETAMGRLASRQKRDQAIFEKKAFQEKIKERFESDWLRTLLEQHGAKVVYIDNEGSEEIFRAKVIQAWEEFVQKK